jgi:uncharacterized membrane protein
MSLSANAKNSNRGRYLLLASLTVNLLLAGAVSTMALQHSTAAPLQPVAGIKRGVEQHFDQIAASMPADDARIMRAEFRLQAVKIAGAEAELRLSEEAVRESLRAQPFDPAAVRAAMAELNAARQRFNELVHDAVADATAKMSPAGRETLADWPTRRANAVIAQ